MKALSSCLSSPEKCFSFSFFPLFLLLQARYTSLSADAALFLFVCKGYGIYFHVCRSVAK